MPTLNQFSATLFLIMNFCVPEFLKALAVCATGVIRST